MFYSLDDRLRLLNFFMQSRRAAEESKFQHAEIGLLTADDWVENSISHPFEIAHESIWEQKRAEESSLA